MNENKLHNGNMREFLKGFDESRFPEDFLKAFDIIECLSQSEYGETFLVASRENGGYAVAKCYPSEVLPHIQEHELLQKLHHRDLPAYIGTYENGEMLCVLREYVAGTPLSKALEEQAFSAEQVVKLGIALCDILQYLHSQDPPVIHRDIKPENIILREDGSVALIDFGISRAYREGADADTMNFGTKSFSAPEQYGYAQTDSRSDLFSLGMVMGYLLTGSVKTDAYHEIDDKRFARVIETCTAFDPSNRYRSVADCHKALVALLPAQRRRRKIMLGAACAVAIAAVSLAAVLLPKAIKPGAVESSGNVPAYITDADITEQAASYLNDKYSSTLFAASTDIADVGYVRDLLVNVYGYDEAYANGRPKAEPPMEVEDSFLPWNFEDAETMRLDVMVYFAVKIYWPEVVADWSSLEGDTGEYPGIRVAKPFAEEKGIYQNVNRPDHITVGDVAVILYNADRAFGDGLPPQLASVYQPTAKPISESGFTEPLMEQAVRAVLGKSETEAISPEELLAVEGLYIFADTVSDSQEGFYAAAGEWYASGMSQKGGIASLADVKLLPNLRILCIAAQSISDLSPLSELPLLEKAELKHNRIGDVSALPGLASLASLGVNDNPVADLTPLGQCKGLRFLDLCDVQGYDPSFLKELGDFEFLDIANRTDSYLYLGSRRVRELKLGYSELDSLACLSEVTGLESLEVKHSKLTSLAGVDTHKELSYLNIAGCAIDDMSPIASLPNLATLVVSPEQLSLAQALGIDSLTIQTE